MFDYSNKLKLMRDMQNLQRIKNVELYAMRLLRAARWIKSRISRRLDIPVGCFVLLFALDCFAQRGTGANPAAAVVAPSVTMFAPALTVVKPPVNKTNLFYNIGLIWDSVDHALVTGYRIRYGTNAASLTNTLSTVNTFCTVSNLAFKPTWYFQAFTLYGTNSSEGSHIVQVQPPIEAGFVLSTVFPLYSSSNLVNWVTNRIVTMVQTNPPGMSFFRSHLRQLDYQWTNNQIRLKPFAL